MSVSGLLARFAIFYPITLIAAGAIVKALGIGHISALNVIIIMALLMFLIERFAKNNARYFTKAEFSGVFIGVIVIDLLFQTLVVLLQGGKPIDISAGAYLISMLITLPLHGIAIYAILKIMPKNLVKRKILIEEGSMVGSD